MSSIEKYTKGTVLFVYFPRRYQKYTKRTVPFVY